MWENLYVFGAIGSEGGTILADEEYKNTCRITLEKCEKHCAITCGVYGAMVHTAFADFDSGYEKYHDMERVLQTFVDTDATLDEERRFYEEFVEKF